MYRRYTNVNREGTSVSQIKRIRIRDAVIFLLAAGLIALAVISVPAMRREKEEKSLYIKKMISECSEAKERVKSLSRNAGADSAQILARIRSHLHGIRTLNETYISRHKTQLVSDDSIRALMDMVDNYLNYIKKGQDTGEYQTNLQMAVEQLENDLNALE